MTKEIQFWKKTDSNLKFFRQLVDASGKSLQEWNKSLEQGILLVNKGKLW